MNGVVSLDVIAFETVTSRVAVNVGRTRVLTMSKSYFIHGGGSDNVDPLVGGIRTIIKKAGGRVCSLIASPYANFFIVPFRLGKNIRIFRGKELSRMKNWPDNFYDYGL